MKKKPTKKVTGKVKAGTSRQSSAQRRALFIEALLANGGNQTQAAIAAGFPESSAHVRGAELVKDSKVAAEVDRRRKEALAKAKLTSDEVLISLAHALRFDPRKLYREDGTLKAVSELDDATAMVLNGLEVVEETSKDDKKTVTKKFRWLDKNVAREQANKHFGHYEKDNSQRADVLRAFYESAANCTRGLPSEQPQR